jgi:perosamine synthetase
MIPVSKPEFNEEMKEAAIYALENEHFVMGESVFKFEEEFAHYIGTKYAVAINSGTAALELALRALGIGRGHFVITPVQSFIATANAITFTGATPRFIDVSISDCNIDISQVDPDGANAILPVHLYGNPCNMDELVNIANDEKMFLIEDVCQAHGAEYRGRKVGSWGDIGCFSFYPTKNMTVCGDGGMVTTNNEEIRDRIASMRDCGRAKGSRYLHSILGYTMRLNTVNAAIGRVQLKYLDRWNERRRQIAKIYDEKLADEIRLTPTHGAKPVYHLYVIKTQLRDKLKEYLQKKEIGTGVHYPIPIHKQPIYNKYNNHKFPNAEWLASSVLSIPMYVSLSDDEAKFVAESINEVIN